MGGERRSLLKMKSVVDVRDVLEELGIPFEKFKEWEKQVQFSTTTQIYTHMPQIKQAKMKQSV
jgi:hypothetical protein